MFNLSIPETNDAAKVNVEFAENTQKAAIMAALKDYVDYLRAKEDKLSKEEIKDKVGQVCSAALDRGVVSMAMIDKICKYVDEFNSVKDQQIAQNRLFQKKSVAEMASNESIIADDPDFKRLKDLKAETARLEEALRFKYGKNIQQATEEFVGEFKGQFEADFIQKVSNLCK